VGACARANMGRVLGTALSSTLARLARVRADEQEYTHTQAHTHTHTHTQTHTHTHTNTHTGGQDDEYFEGPGDGDGDTGGQPASQFWGFQAKSSGRPAELAASSSRGTAAARSGGGGTRFSYVQLASSLLAPLRFTGRRSEGDNADEAMPKL
jgi:hypothetical protein